MPEKKKPLSLLDLMKPKPYELPRYSLDIEERGPMHGVVPGNSMMPVAPIGGGRDSGPSLGMEGGLDRTRGIYPEVSAGYNYQRGPNQYGVGATYQADPQIQGGPRQVPGLMPGYGGINFNWRREF